MATCPECDAEIEVDEFDVDKGDLISCPDCGSNLEVIGLSPVELEMADGPCSETGCTFLHVRHKADTHFVKISEKYAGWSRGMRRDEVGAAGSPTDEERRRLVEQVLGG